MLLTTESDRDEYGHEIRRLTTRYRLLDDSQIGVYPDQAEELYEYDEYGNCTRKVEDLATYTYEYDIPSDAEEARPLIKMTKYEPEKKETTADAPEWKEVSDEEREATVTGRVEKRHHEADPETGGGNYDYDYYVIVLDESTNLYVLSVDSDLSVRWPVTEIVLDLIPDGSAEREQLENKHISCTVSVMEHATGAGDFISNATNVKILD